MPNPTRPLAFAAISATVITLVCCAAFVVAAMGGSAPVTTSTAVLLLVVARPVLNRAGRWALGDRGPAVAGITLAGTSVSLFLAALFTLARPVLESHRFRCGTGDMMLLMMAPFGIFVGAALASLVAVGTARVKPAGLELRMRWVARAATAAGAALVALSLARAARFPDPDHYVASLPVVARVPAVSGTPVAERSVPRIGCSAETQRVYEEPVGEGFLRRVCCDGRCDVLLSRFQEGKFPPPQGKESPEWYGRTHIKDDATIEVRRDAAHDLWVVGSDPGDPYVRRNLSSEDVHVADLEDRLSPPRGWIAGAGLGLAAAAALLLRRRSVARRLAAIEAGRAGILEASGVVRFGDDEPPVRVAPGQALAEGPVVVLSSAPAPEGGYRDDPSQGGARVACGTRAELVGRVQLEIAALDALVFAACALAGAPLGASALVGIVL